MKRLFPLLFLVCLLSAPVWSADNVLPKPDGEEGFIYFTSEEASADPAAKKVNLQGDVTIVQHTKEGFARTAKGEDITLDQANTTVSSVGPMQVETESGTLNGNNLSVNYETKDFYAENTSTVYPPLRVISAKELSSRYPAFKRCGFDLL